MNININIELTSSCKDSITVLNIQNVEESLYKEILSILENASSFKDMYVLLEVLKKILNMADIHGDKNFILLDKMKTSVRMVTYR